MVPRDGIEPPKNLDINGLDTVFHPNFTSIPDKQWKSEQKLGAGPENSCHCRSSYPLDTSEAELKKVGLKRQGRD